VGAVGRQFPDRRRLACGPVTIRRGFRSGWYSRQIGPRNTARRRSPGRKIRHRAREHRTSDESAVVRKRRRCLESRRFRAATPPLSVIGFLVEASYRALEDTLQLK